VTAHEKEPFMSLNPDECDHDEGLTECDGYDPGGRGEDVCLQ
jgi:hypothetical protein